MAEEEDDEAGMVVETIGPAQRVLASAAWEKQVRLRCRGVCANCESADHLRAVMVVPQRAGGRRVVSNGTLLCRACELASTAHKEATAGEVQPISVWVSRKLYDKIEAGVETKTGFASKAALLRYLMRMYVTAAERFNDVEQYQDSDPVFSSGARISTWVETELYNQFQERVRKQGWKVSEALRYLLVMYDLEVAPLIKPKE